jgi:hypothetical protein
VIGQAEDLTARLLTAIGEPGHRPGRADPAVLIVRGSSDPTRSVY